VRLFGVIWESVERRKSAVDTAAGFIKTKRYKLGFYVLVSKWNIQLWR